MKQHKKNMLKVIMMSLVIGALTACGSTSTPPPTKAEITDTGEQDAQIILDNNNTIEGIAEGIVNYERSLDSDERAQARRIAKEGLIRKFVAQKMPNLQRNYAANQELINERLADLLLTEQVISQETNSDNKTYKVTIRAQINEPALLAILMGEPEDAEASEIAFVFMAREDVGQNPEDTSGSEKSEIKWRVNTTNEVDVAMGSVFADNNFVVVSAAVLQQESDLQFNVDAFKKDYEVGDDVSSETLGTSIIALRNLEQPVQFLALGTLDVDRSMTDPVSGNIKVAVAVTGQVLNVLRRGSRVASIGPVQYFGEGPTLTIAKNNALKSAGVAAAKVLAGQLRAKSIR